MPNDAIDAALNISKSVQLEPIKQSGKKDIELPAIKVDSIPPIISTTKDAEEDYVFVRDKIKELVSIGFSNLEKAVLTAEDTGSPRGWEVTSIMMKNLSDVVEKLTALHIKTAELKRILDFSKLNTSGTSEGNSPTVNIEKGVFLGSADLLRMIKDGQNELKNINEYDSKNNTPKKETGHY